MSSIIKKMNLGFSGIFALLVILSGTSYVKQQQISKDVQDLIEFDVEMLKLVKSMYSNSLEARILEKDIVLHSDNIDFMKNGKISWDSNIKKNEELINKMLEITKKSGEVDVEENIKKFQLKLNNYQKHINETYSLIDSKVISDKNSVLNHLMKLTTEAEEMTNILKGMVEEEEHHIGNRKVELVANNENLKQITLILSLSVLGIFLIIGYSLVRAIRKPLVDFKDKSRLIISNNDLTVRFNESNDEFGDIGRDVNSIIFQMSKSVGLTIQSSRENLSKSDIVVKKSSDIAKSIEKQSDEMSKTAAAIEELTVSIQQVSESSKYIKQNMLNVAGISKSGMVLSNDTKKIIQNIVVDFEELTKLLNNLEVTSNNISSIVSTIRDIADQTNLLALNAAIEAARAGEAGRGFAVVADEVRKLSENTAKATTKISEMIVSVQVQSKDVTQVINRTNDKVRVGVEKVEETNDKINEIGDLISKTEVQISEITNSINEEQIVAVDISKAVEEIAQISEKNALNAKDSENIVIELKNSANDLVNSVSKFRV